MLSLSGWTVLVDFLALAASLWLGIYVITRGPRAPVSWLAGLTLWSLSGYFLDSVLHLYPPQERALSWWTGWTIFFCAPLWLHLTTLLLPGRGWGRWLWVGATYLLAIVLLIVEQSTGAVFGVWLGRSFVYASSQLPGPLYPLVCLLLIVFPFFSLYNLFTGWRQSARLALRRQFQVLMLATLLAACGGAYLVLSVWLGWEVPLLPGHGVLGMAVVLLGYGIARYNALVEGRTSRVDFTYSLLAIVLVVSVYLVVTYLTSLVFQISLVVFIFVLMLVILSHSLYEWGGTTLERLFYRRRYRELRANLRAFAREAANHELSDQLGAVLEALCRSLGCSWGWVALHQENEYTPAAVYPVGYRPHVLPGPDLLAQEAGPVYLPGERGEASPATLVPLYTRGEQIGAIVLGARAGVTDSAGDYDDAELDVLDALSDRVASLVYVARQQQEAVSQIETLVKGFRQREQALRQELQSVLAAEQARGQQEIRAQVEDALRHLHDYPYLGEQVLARLQIVDRYLEVGTGVITHLDRGKALSRFLIEVIEKLRPPGPQPKTITREWVQYTILHDAYVLGELNRDIMLKLYISESSFNRARRRAVRGVARAVKEMEQAAQA